MIWDAGADDEVSAKVVGKGRHWTCSVRDKQNNNKIRYNIMKLVMKECAKFWPRDSVCLDNLQTKFLAMI
jgi:hypothetical protein